jgi:hypothetical protein
MWINRDVDLPQTLISAQRDGRLVIFAGAGVSMGPPSNLPDFATLARAIAAGVLTPKVGEELDAFLGRVEQHGVDVQASARQLIDVPTSTPRRLHQLVVDLFPDESAVRIVTTNFDRHFTTRVRAMYPGIDIFTAPALPLGRDWNGLIYLHGAVERPRSRLILTDRDFGLGYLADGWATRFLMEMFRQYAVLFVGYSHSDPVMRYLARSFVGGTERFALTLHDRDDHWNHLGIVPVHFPLRPAPDRFGALESAIADWTALARMGIFDHQARIGRLVELPPPLDPENIDYLKVVLAERVTLQFFVQQATRIEWLTWTEAEGFLAPLLRRAPIDSLEPRLFALWFAERFVVQHAKKALTFFQQHLGTVNAVLTEAIAIQLAVRADTVPTELLRLWSMALMAADDTPTRSLTRLLRKCAEVEDADTTLLLFRWLLRPRLEFDPMWAAFRQDDRPLALDTEIVFRGDAYELREAWNGVLKPTIAAHHQQLLSMITDWMHEANSLLRAGGRAGDEWDPMSHKRSAIEPHGQDHTSDDWGLAVDVARDVLEWLTEHEPAIARMIIESWSGLRPLLLRRLAIHGTARRTDLTASDALDLIARQDWLYASSLKHETFELLRAVFARADEAAQRRFVAYSMAANVLPETVAADADTARLVAYERYNVAVWLHQVALDSTIATDHLAALQQQHPEFEPRDHPDLDYWIGAGFVGPRTPISVEDLSAMGSADAARYLRDYEPSPQDFHAADRSGLMTTFGQAAVASTEWSLGVADALVTDHVWESELWTTLLGAWRSSSLEGDAWRRVLHLIETHADIGTGSPLATADFIEEAMDRAGLSNAELQSLEAVGERLLAASDTMPPGVHLNGDLDWYSSAINHPAGRVARAWIKDLSIRMTGARDDWHGLSENQRNRFDTLLGGAGHNAAIARVVFASQVHFLFAADRGWTETHIVPLFDWDADPERGAQAWSGFLASGRWNAVLFERMQPFVIQTFSHMNDLGDEKRNFVSRLAAAAAYSQADPWHNNGWLFQYINLTEPEDRAAWAGEFEQSVESLSADGAGDLWNRWVAAYWDARLLGVPHPLADVERQAMVRWLCAFKAQFANAVERLLRALPESLDHRAFYSLARCGVADAHGAELGRLLRSLMANLTELRHDTGEVFALAWAALNHGAARADMLVVAGEMVRLACDGGEQLRQLADTPPP